MLTLEEQFLYTCVQSWRTPEQVALPAGLDWDKVAAVGKANRMATLLQQLFIANGMEAQLTPAARDLLWNDAARLRRDAVTMAEALRGYLQLAQQRAIASVVLKGLDLSINIYGNPAMRPGGDIDILVHRQQLAASIRVLDALDFGPWWPNLMQDIYYERHHLHLQRCTRDRKIWFEIHWALDHPYNLLTVDYTGMLERTQPGVLLGEPVRDLALPDRILALVLHLVKHATYLPTVSGRADLPRIILADGMLMYYLDVAEVIKLHAAAIDWAFTIQLAQAWGMVEMLGAVLRVCQQTLGAPVPAWVIAALPVQGTAGLTRRILTQMAEYELATYTGAARSGLWDFLVVTNGAFILRPIRLLDVAAYFLPDDDFLRRRYGVATPATAVRHFLTAAAQYTQVGVDTLYYMGERYRRLKALNQSASLFNRLDTGG